MENIHTLLQNAIKTTTNPSKFKKGDPPIKIRTKDSWSREEVIDLLSRLKHRLSYCHTELFNTVTSEWLEKNV